MLKVMNPWEKVSWFYNADHLIDLINEQKDMIVPMTDWFLAHFWKCILFEFNVIKSNYQVWYKPVRVNFPRAVIVGQQSQMRVVNTRQF